MNVHGQTNFLRLCHNKLAEKCRTLHKNYAVEQEHVVLGSE